MRQCAKAHVLLVAHIAGTTQGTAGRMLKLKVQLPLLILALALFRHADAQELPHVNDCNYCQTCYFTKDKTYTLPQGASAQGDIAGNAGLIVPSKQDIESKQKKANCTECWGCTTRIELLKGVQAFGHDFKVEVGASPEWLFVADLPDTPQTGRKAIVKVWCMPIDKVHGTFKWTCHNEEIAKRGSQHLIALNKVTEECGLDDITIKVWLAPVNAVLPGSGLHVWWYGLWMERAEGLSMNQLSYIGRRDVMHKTVIELLGERLNKTRVVRSALFDLLISQCDRHAQNVFLGEDGNIRLIDNMQSLKMSWQHCGVDSIFLPGTQKNEIVRFGGDAVGKKQRARVRRSVNPMLVLDYRCYVPNQEIGTNYPPEVSKCLQHLSSMTAEQVQAQYGFPEAHTAKWLQIRATAMASKGFEWALQQGEPLNRNPLRYKWHQPCCKLKIGAGNVVQCAHAWNATPEFPKGDPLRGGVWNRPYEDPGTYIGGTVF